MRPTIRLAGRVSQVGESATLKVSRRAGELRRSGAQVIDFGAGEPDFDSPEIAVEAACRALRQGFTRYTATTGIPPLREALAERYGRVWGSPWGPDQVAVTVGGKGALFELSLALLEEGTEMVIPSPYWVTFPEQARLAGARPVIVPMDPADGFRIHAQPLIDALTDRTRVVLINAPANPTGGVIAEEDLDRLVEACAERGILLVSDETYERFLYEGEPLSAARWARSHPDTVVVVGSFSKTYAMTGWRLGFVLAPPPVLAAVATIQSHATSNPTSFAMAGALAALEGAEGSVEEMIAEYRRRRDYLIPRLNALPGVTCEPPAGAFYAFPRVDGRYSEEIPDSAAFSEWLLEEIQVAVVPGVAFGADDHIRLSFACSMEELEAGLDRMAALLAG